MYDVNDITWTLAQAGAFCDGITKIHLKNNPKEDYDVMYDYFWAIILNNLVHKA